MSMAAETYNAWSLLLQATLGVAVVATFVVYFLQLLAMRGQLSAARDASLAQNLLAIHTFIFQETLREDRRKLFVLNEEGKRLAQWDATDKIIAERVCAAWDLVALMISKGLVPFELMSDLRYSMTKSHKIVEEMLSNLRTERSPFLWQHFTTVVRRFENATALPRGTKSDAAH